MKILLFTFVLCTISKLAFSSDQVLILTSAYNRPDFVEMQYKTFRKFLSEDHELVVFNDANQPDLKKAIEATCFRLGIRCFNIPQKIHNQPYLKREKGEDFNLPAVRNANVVQYALNHLGFFHDGIVIIIDSDMFLTKPFSAKKLLKDTPIAGVPQSYQNNGIAISYLWIGLAFLDMTRLPNKESLNFNCGRIRGVPVDAGGYTYYYLQNHPEIKPTYFSMLHDSNLRCSNCQQNNQSTPCTHNLEKLLELGLDNDQISLLQNGFQNFEFGLNLTFLHYRGGSNWDHRSREFHETKTRLFSNYLNKITQD